MALPVYSQTQQERQQNIYEEEINPATNSSNNSRLNNHDHLEQHTVLELVDTNHTSDQNMTSTDDSNYKAYGWTVIAAAFAILFIGVGYTNTFGVFQEYYQGTLFPNEPADKIIVISSTAASLYFILGVFTGRFTDFVGYRISLILGATLMVGSMFAASFSREYWQLFLSQGLMFGLGVAFVYPTTTTISRQYFGPSKHGIANGIVVSGGALGGCILPYSVKRIITI